MQNFTLSFLNYPRKELYSFLHYLSLELCKIQTLISPSFFFSLTMHEKLIFSPSPLCKKQLYYFLLYMFNYDIQETKFTLFFFLSIFRLTKKKRNFTPLLYLSLCKVCKQPIFTFFFFIQTLHSPSLFLF